MVIEVVRCMDGDRSGEHSITFNCTFVLLEINVMLYSHFIL